MIDTDELKWLGEAPRMAAYRTGANGRSAAQIGLAAALLRTSGNAPAARAVAPAKPKASNNPARSRIQIVADAVANDPACKGKAQQALNMLADDAYAKVSGKGVVKLLKAGASADAPTAQSVAEARDKAMRAEMKAAIFSTGNSGIAPDGGGASRAANRGWPRVIADMNRRNGFQ